MPFRHVPPHFPEGYSASIFGRVILKRTLFNATAMQTANQEVVYATYHPDSPVAGPDADNFKKRRKEFFTGWLAAGISVEDVLNDLASKGLPFVDVGLGNCGGRKKIEQIDGSSVDPPCIGQLKCNPMQCKNAVITKMHLPIWRKMLEENLKRLNDPLMAHARPEIERHIVEARNVLQSLDEKSI